MEGYKDKALELLETATAEVGDRIKIKKDDESHEGILLPRTELGDTQHIVLKLDSGYNLGIKATENTEIEKIGEGKKPEMSVSETEYSPNPEKPDISIVGTGGTIASKVDYRTGAVHPAFSAQEIYSAVPELAEIANIETVVASNVLSENMSLDLWKKIGENVAEELNQGADGVVVAHGTDTMGYTSAALSFMLKDLTKPVVLVGSQRSSDRPSSDAALNLISAVTVASSDLSEVCVVMHGSTEDDFCSIHRGTKVRKCHTSRRDAFQSVNEHPIGKVQNGEVDFFQEVEGRAEGQVKVDSEFEEKVEIVKTHPNIQSDIIENLLNEDYKGIVIEGTGLGHTPKSLYSGIEKAINAGVPVVMTSQCLWGRVNMRVYSTGRDLLDMGVIPCEDMLPETAFVKLMWVLGHTNDLDEVKDLMLSNLAGEITPRSRPDTFLKPNFPED
ncbi:MAG: Glu-tRNA(Gln) amidotransferase subunit GatD [Hadesarchaea archaeon]|nr:Glu-tRNA(Gln) amidotransferase subunit GatD [Hadesarchaea archaeon]